MSRFLVLVSFVFLLLSCEKDFILEDGMIYKCEFEDDGTVGYIVGAGEGYSSTLYYDEDVSIAYNHIEIDVKKKLWKFYATSELFDERRCIVTEYINPAEDSIPEGKEYITSKYTPVLDGDVIYGYANGYWTSYPQDNSSYLDIVTKKIPLLMSQTQQTLLLDVYQPEEDTSSERPLIVFIHAGAFYNGDKADIEYREWCKSFASFGYTAVSVNYRLGFSAPILLLEDAKDPLERAAYRSIQDVNAAIRFLLAHQEYRVDPDRIFLAGCSAGAVTALHVAFMTNEDRPKSTYDKIKGNITIHDDLGPMESVSPEYKNDFDVRGVGNMWGAVMDPSIIGNASTSIISFHDINDPVVPYSIGVPFVDVITNYLSEFEILGDLIRYSARELLPSVYGSEIVNSLALEEGLTTELHEYSESRHTLVKDEGTQQLNSHFYEMTEKMAVFFQNNMVDTPVELDFSYSSNYVEIEDPSDVEVCTWSITEGGVITDALGPYAVRILLFDDGSRSDRVLTVEGVYKSGIAFSKSIVLDFEL